MASKRVLAPFARLSRAQPALVPARLPSLQARHASLYSLSSSAPSLRQPQSQVLAAHLAPQQQLRWSSDSSSDPSSKTKKYSFDDLVAKVDQHRGARHARIADRHARVKDKVKQHNARVKDKVHQLGQAADDALLEATDPGSGLVIVDVREPEEIAATGVIPGAFNIPIESYPDALFLPEDEFVETWGFARPDAGDEVVFYCKGGVRSRAAAAMAVDAWGDGVIVAEYPGSWIDWEKNGGEVERSPQ